MFATAQLAATSARQGLGRPSDHIAIDVSSDGSGPVEGDQHQLLQALVALIDNALLAVVDRKAGRVEVRVSGHERVTIHVDDDGPGVSPSLLDRVFDPFVTGRPRHGPRPGTGLGLSIVQGIVERHYGSVGASSSPLGGARFSVSLPAQRPPVASADDLDAQP